MNLRQLKEKYKEAVPPYWRKKVGLGIFALILAAAAALEFFWYDEAPLTVYFYNVGQGDAIHIRTQDGFDVLIDGGPTSALAEKVGRTLPFWDRTIELMVLTHPHADHVVGLIDILKQFEVERVLATGVIHTTDEYLTWLKEIKARGISMEIAQAGQVWTLRHLAALSPTKTALVRPSEPDGACARPSSPPCGGAMPAVPAQHFCCESPPPSDLAEIKLKILYPEENFEGERVKEGKIGEGGGLNDTSIVARLEYGQTSFLFMGDATSKVEEQLLANSDLLIVDVLKVGHHGSKYSTSREFLETVKPKYAVIQVGKNRYGHPAYAPLHRLKQAGVEVLRNDQDGDVVFESDGLDIKKVP